MSLWTFESQSEFAAIEAIEVAVKEVGIIVSLTFRAQGTIKMKDI